MVKLGLNCRKFAQLFSHFIKQVHEILRLIHASKQEKIGAI